MFVLLLTVFVDLVGFGIIFPVLPFLALEFGASALEVTALVAVYSGMQIVFGPVWGRLSDRFGRKPVLIATLIGGGLGYAWFGLAQSLGELFLARALTGIMAGHIPVAQAFLADITPPERRAEAMGRFGAAFGLGFVVGPALGALLIGDAAAPDFTRPALAAGGLAWLSALLGLVILREPARQSRRAEGRRGWRAIMHRVSRADLLIILGLTLFVTFTFSEVIAIFPLFAEARLGFGPVEVGWCYSVIGLLVAILQGLVLGPATRRAGEGRVLLTGALGLFVGMAMTPWVEGIASLGVQIVLLCIGTSFCHPTLTALVSRRAPAGDQGAVMGVASAVASTGRIGGPPFAGALFEQHGPDMPLIVGALLVLPVVATAAWFARHREEPRPPDRDGTAS